MMESIMKDCPHLKIIDSHTEGEPTRVIVDGCPELFGKTMAEKRDELQEKHDWIRNATVLEPRGFEAMVGAVLTEPCEPDCVAGVVFYNNAGYLNMCIHGTVGLAVTLKHMGVISSGSHKIDTPVGVVTIHLNDDGSVSVDNVPSYRAVVDQPVEVPGYGIVTGDIAWGGNWFYLINEQGPAVIYENVDALIDFTVKTMAALEEQGIRGADGGLVDHIEVFGPPANENADSRNFVMCPGGEYDRSPCGTGTSAKLACLFDAGKLEEGMTWRQAGILNTVFYGKVRAAGDGKVIPTVTAKAWVNGETTVIVKEDDPFALGIHAATVA